MIASHSRLRRIFAFVTIWKSNLVASHKFVRQANVLTLKSPVQHLNSERHLYRMMDDSKQHHDTMEINISMDCDSSGLTCNIADMETFKSIFTPQLLKLKEICVKNGMDIRMAGGAVRDILQGIHPHDIDFATTTLPGEMKEIFTRESVRIIEYGERAEGHGTVTVRIDDTENYEITTTRSDLLCNGRHAEVIFHTDWKEDSNRRDLTINSMYLDLDGNLYDFFGGRKDLEEKQVRFVGNADDRIKEDYLRIMRYFRFYGKIKALPEDHDEATLEIIRRDASGLSGVAGERIWVELKKIVRGHFADHQIKHLIELGVGKYIGFPHQCDPKKFSEVYETVVDGGYEFLEVTLLASLFSTVEEVASFHKRLKLSKLEYNTILHIVQEREDYSKGDIKRYRGLVVKSKEQKSMLRRCIELAVYMDDWKVYKSLSEWEIPKFPFSAKFLVDRGVPKGKELSDYVEQVKDHWIRNNFTDSQNDLNEYAERIIVN